MWQLSKNMVTPQYFNYQNWATVNFDLETTPPDIPCNGKNKQRYLNSFVRRFF